MLKRRRLLANLAAISLASGLSVTTTLAAVTVRGPQDALELTASEATLQEALERLSAAYGLELHGTEGLSEPVSGTLTGSLSSVIDQLLGSRNHFTRPNGPNLALYVLTAPSNARSAAASAASAAAAGAPAETAVDPLRDQLEKPIILSPAGQETAVQMFGEKGRRLQVDESLLQSFYGHRGAGRFQEGAVRLPH